jgi:hypothetical protein
MEGNPGDVNDLTGRDEHGDEHGDEDTNRYH